MNGIVDTDDSFLTKSLHCHMFYQVSEWRTWYTERSFLIRIVYTKDVL